MLTTTTSSVSYSTNGSTTVFATTFPYWAATDIVVKLKNNSTGAVTTLVLTTNYTFSGGSGAVGNVTTVATYATGYTLLITRSTARTQDVDLENNADFEAESLEAQLDKTVAMVQENSNTNSRAVLGSEFDVGTVDFTLPTVVANRGLKWNSAGTGFENTDGDPDDAAVYAGAAQVYASAAEAAKNDAEAAQTAAEAAQAAAEAAASSVPTTASLLNAVYPIGCVVTLGVSTNPATLFCIGTWSAIAGRVIVGIDSGQTEFDTLNETVGAKTHTLTTNEMPSHSHTFTDYVPTSGPADYVAGNKVSNTPETVTTSTAGSGQAHNNLQPYIVKYVWQRTA